MEKFVLTGLKSPGRISLPHHGTIELEKIDDTLAEILWRQGVPFLKPKPQNIAKMYPGEKSLTPKTFTSPVKTSKPKSVRNKTK
jgi:hypothetical protein